MSDYKFIAGAVCPMCGDMDSITLKTMIQRSSVFPVIIPNKKTLKRSSQ